MSLAKATATGNLTAALDLELRRVSAALRRAVTTAGAQVQSALRTQARGAGFKDGGRALANSWRLKIYPEPGRGPKTLKPAAVVHSRMPTVAEAFDRGVTVRAKGGKYLAYPTGFNAAGGRRNAGRRGGLRVTPAQMIAAGKRGEAFVLPSKKDAGRALWCLRITQENRNKRRVRIFVGRSTEVATGSRKGAAQRKRDLLKQGFVPMFFLARSVTLRKRLDIAAVRRAAPAWFAHAAARELARVV